jgi:hypothetical protein
VTAGTAIREVRSLPHYKRIQMPSRRPQRAVTLIDAVRDCADENPDIVHVGVFGSVAGRLACVHEDQHSTDNDLDLLVVLGNEENRVRVKRALRQAIASVDKEAQVVWSNESSEFYSIRRGYQVDIQVHGPNEQYYVDNPLLGWAVFSMYQVLYSAGDAPVSVHIPVPTDILSMQARVDECLNNRKFGVQRFIVACSSAEACVDPRRVISINTRNFAWAMSGTRPTSLSQAISFLDDQVKKDICRTLMCIHRRSTENAVLNQHNDLQFTLKYLESIAAALGKHV